jgi:Bardet-Biedl syndrome 4 protein
MLLNPQNPDNFKQLARGYFLLGQHAESIQLYAEALAVSQQSGQSPDWEIHHHLGLAHLSLKDYERAISELEAANRIQRHDVTFLKLGHVYALTDRLSEAEETYMEALEFSPENPELLTTLGLLYLRMGDTSKAFESLGNSLTHAPTDPTAILAVGSILQDNEDADVALVKYRVAAVRTPASGQLWNNIGLCFFSKGKLVAAISCLKRALALDPFEWITLYNLGLVHLHSEQFASAFHYLSASINLKHDFSLTFVNLAITLSRMDDFLNARDAYEKALQLDKDQGGDSTTAHFNYVVLLANKGDFKEAREHLEAFERSSHEEGGGILEAEWEGQAEV